MKYDDTQINSAYMSFIAVLDMADENTVDGESVVIVPVAEFNSLIENEEIIKEVLRTYVLRGE